MTFHDPFSNRSEVRGDPQAWWRQYRDVGTRSTFLRAYAAERLDNLFETVRIKYKPCIGCGGDGVTKKASIRSLAGGKHEWIEHCRRCYGSGRDRVVAYR